VSQHGPLISYDVSRIPVTMTVATQIGGHVEKLFRENYGLRIDEVREEEGFVTFIFHEEVDGHTFLRHLQTATPEQYGSV